MCQMCAGICLLLSDIDTADVLIETPFAWKLLLTVSEYPSDRLSKPETVASTNHQNQRTYKRAKLQEMTVEQSVAYWIAVTPIILLCTTGRMEDFKAAQRCFIILKIK